MSNTFIDVYGHTTITVSDAVYSASWDGDINAATKNAIYDKIETITGGVIGALVDDTAYAPSWDGVTTIAPSKNAVYDKVATLAPLISPVFTTPQINDTSADHQYIVAVSELAADRTITLPLLTGDDDFVFEDHTQTLTNKTLTSPKIGTAVTDTNGNEIIETPATASAANHIKVTNAAASGTPEIAAAGSDTNVALSVVGKGTGDVTLGSYAISIQVTEFGQDISTGDGAAIIPMPSFLNGYNLVDCLALVDPANPPTGSTLDIQIHNDTDSVDVLSTKLTIDAGESTSATAATPHVIDTNNDDVDTGDYWRIDIDQVGSANAGQGLAVILYFRKP